MGWWKEWADAGTKAKERAERERCERCNGPMVVGYSNLGIPLTTCPACSPALVENGQRTLDDVFGVDHG